MASVDVGQTHQRFFPLQLMKVRINSNYIEQEKQIQGNEARSGSFSYWRGYFLIFVVAIPTYLLAYCFPNFYSMTHLKSF